MLDYFMSGISGEGGVVGASGLRQRRTRTESGLGLDVTISNHSLNQTSNSFQKALEDSMNTSEIVPYDPSEAGKRTQEADERARILKET